MISVEKPWGKFTTYALNEKCTVKILEINKGGILSLQKHKKRSEKWIPLDEGVTIQTGKKKFNAKKGKEYLIPKNSLHRAGAKKKSRILEISSGKFDEKDIIRVEDKYGRIVLQKKSKKNKS